MEEELAKFLQERIPCWEDDCNDCDTSTDHKPKSKEGTKQVDPIKDIERYMHTILDSDDQEDIECKDSYNQALIQHRDVYILHDKMEDLNKLNKEKLKEMKQNHNPKSEKFSNRHGTSLTQMKTK